MKQGLSGHSKCMFPCSPSKPEVSASITSNSDTPNNQPGSLFPPHWGPWSSPQKTTEELQGWRYTGFTWPGQPGLPGPPKAYSPGSQAAAKIRGAVILGLPKGDQ